VQQSAEALSRAQRPVLVVGSQTMLPPVLATEVRRAIESLGLPCYLSGMARGLLGTKSSIQMRHNRGDALKEADLIILAGVVCDFRLSYGRTLNKQATIISVNRDKIQLYKVCHL
jgi:acetolactate synthase-like protein